MTDQNNAPETPEPGTVQSFNYEFPVNCVTTALTVDRLHCTANTTADALIPGTVLESNRTVWEIDQATIKDAGPNGTGYAACPPTCGDGDETTFLRVECSFPDAQSRGRCGGRTRLARGC